MQERRTLLFMDKDDIPDTATSNFVVGNFVKTLYIPWFPINYLCDFGIILDAFNESGDSINSVLECDVENHYINYSDVALCSNRSGEYSGFVGDSLLSGRSDLLYLLKSEYGVLSISSQLCPGMASIINYYIGVSLVPGYGNTLDSWSEGTVSFEDGNFAFKPGNIDFNSYNCRELFLGDNEVKYIKIDISKLYFSYMPSSNNQEIYKNLKLTYVGGTNDTNYPFYVEYVNN